MVDNKIWTATDVAKRKREEVQNFTIPTNDRFFNKKKTIFAGKKGKLSKSRDGTGTGNRPVCQ